MFKKLSLYLFILLISLAFINACGSEDPVDVDFDDLRGDTYTKHFSQEEIDSVYTDELEDIDGEIWPMSLPPLAGAFYYDEATDTFKDKWGKFTIGAEFKGYINLANEADDFFQGRLLESFEAISTWKNVKDDSGKPLFKDTYTTNSSFKRIPDQVDGFAPVDGEIHNGRLIMKVSGFNLNVDGEVFLSNDKGSVFITFKNVRPIKAPFVGTVVKEKGLNLAIRLYPYQNGWLVYGVCTMKMEKFKDSFKPKDAKSTIESFFDWIKGNVIVPVQ